MKKAKVFLTTLVFCASLIVAPLTIHRTQKYSPAENTSSSSSEPSNIPSEERPLEPPYQIPMEDAMPGEGDCG